MNGKTIAWIIAALIVVILMIYLWNRNKKAASEDQKSENPLHAITGTPGIVAGPKIGTARPGANYSET